MPHRARRWLLVAIAAACVILAVDVNGAPARAENSGGAEQQLAERYRPVIQTVTQSRECGPGEPYRPTTVESVLGRPGVVLRDATGAVIVDAPTSADLFARPEGTSLDLPGNPLRPGCTYERWWRSIEAGLPTATYARVASDPERPGKLVVQYWFWWVFNDWNDKHEGDWEMVQVVFDATTADQALGQAPVQVVFAQHEGAQYRAWDDPALERDGDRLVYYPGEGSHAGYDSANRWFGKSASAGFGCDDTRAPNTRLDPDVVLLPASPSDVTAPPTPSPGSPTRDTGDSGNRRSTMVPSDHRSRSRGPTRSAGWRRTGDRTRSRSPPSRAAPAMHSAPWRRQARCSSSGS